MGRKAAYKKDGVVTVYELDDDESESYNAIRTKYKDNYGDEYNAAAADFFAGADRRRAAAKPEAPKQEPQAKPDITHNGKTLVGLEEDDEAEARAAEKEREAKAFFNPSAAVNLNTPGAFSPQADFERREAARTRTEDEGARAKEAKPKTPAGTNNLSLHNGAEKTAGGDVEYYETVDENGNAVYVHKDDVSGRGGAVNESKPGTRKSTHSLSDDTGGFRYAPEQELKLIEKHGVEQTNAMMEEGYRTGVIGKDSYEKIGANKDDPLAVLIAASADTLVERGTNREQLVNIENVQNALAGISAKGHKITIAGDDGGETAYDPSKLDGTLSAIDGKKILVDGKPVVIEDGETLNKALRKLNGGNDYAERELAYKGIKTSAAPTTLREVGFESDFRAVLDPNHMMNNRRGHVTNDDVINWNQGFAEMQMGIKSALSANEEKKRAMAFEAESDRKFTAWFDKYGRNADPNVVSQKFNKFIEEQKQAAAGLGLRERYINNSIIDQKKQQWAQAVQKQSLEMQREARLVSAEDRSNFISSEAAAGRMNETAVRANISANLAAVQSDLTPAQMRKFAETSFVSAAEGLMSGYMAGQKIDFSLDGPLPDMAAVSAGLGGITARMTGSAAAAMGNEAASLLSGKLQKGAGKHIAAIQKGYEELIKTESADTERLLAIGIDSDSGAAEETAEDALKRHDAGRVKLAELEAAGLLSGKFIKHTAPGLFSDKNLINAGSAVIAQAFKDGGDSQAVDGKLKSVTETLAGRFPRKNSAELHDDIVGGALDLLGKMGGVTGIEPLSELWKGSGKAFKNNMEAAYRAAHPKSKEGPPPEFEAEYKQLTRNLIILEVLTASDAGKEKDAYGLMNKVLGNPMLLGAEVKNIDLIFDTKEAEDPNTYFSGKELVERAKAVYDAYGNETAYYSENLLAQSDAANHTAAKIKVSAADILSDHGIGDTVSLLKIMREPLVYDPEAKGLVFNIGHRVSHSSGGSNPVVYIIKGDNAVYQAERRGTPESGYSYSDLKRMKSSYQKKKEYDQKAIDRAIDEWAASGNE